MEKVTKWFTIIWLPLIVGFPLAIIIGGVNPYEGTDNFVFGISTVILIASIGYYFILDIIAIILMYRWVTEYNLREFGVKSQGKWHKKQKREKELEKQELNNQLNPDKDEASI